MIKRILPFIIIVFCNLWIISFSFAKNERVVFDSKKMTIITSTRNIDYDVEIAKTKEQLEFGLKNRKKLADNGAMLFIFKDNEKEHKNIQMWMKDTLISLDILFIDKLGKIVYIARDTEPNSLDIISAGDISASAVLEINGGTAKTRNINLGDQITYKVF